jgi:hypothetical protein
MRQRILLVTLACLALSCSDQSPTAPTANVSALVPKGSVQVVIQQDTHITGDSALFIVNVVGNDVPVAAYQGTITFSPGALEVLSVRTPPANAGEFRIVNDRETGAGRIRFAGFSPEAFGSTEALRIVARVTRGLSATNMVGTLDVAGETAGTAVRKQNLRASDGLRDAELATIAVAAGNSNGTQVRLGGKLAVPIVIDMSAAGGNNLASITSGVGWDATRLTLDSVRAASFGTLTTNATSGHLTLDVFNPSGTTASATIANLYFTAAGTRGGTRLVVDATTAGSAAGTDLGALLRVRSLDVCIAQINKWGDVTGDDAVNVIDAQQIARAAVGLSVLNSAAFAATGDVTGDGVIDVLDAQQISRFTLGLGAAARLGTAIALTPPVATVSLSSPSANVDIGRIVQLAATPADAGNTPLTGCAPVTWSSSDPSVATVGGDGSVTGVSPGTATITATSGVHNGSTSISTFVTAAIKASAGPSLAGLLGHEVYGRQALLGFDSTELAQVLYDSDWRRTVPPSCPSTDTLKTFMRWRLRGGWSDVAPVVLDIENGFFWTTRDDYRKNAADLSFALDCFRASFPGRKVGIYGIGPTYSSTALHDTAHGTAWQNWLSFNEELAPLLARVDFLAPSLYPFSPDTADWKLTANALLGVARTIAGGKPILPFLMPRFHPSVTSRFGTWVDTTYWALQHRIVRQRVGGTIVWCCPETLPDTAHAQWVGTVARARWAK